MAYLLILFMFARFASTARYTYNFCDTPTNDCPSCQTSKKLHGFFDSHEKNITLSPESYLLYKMIETEYLVEFSKNPMAWETAVNLPYCGLLPAGLKPRELSSEAFGVNQKRNIFEDIVNAIGRIDIPWLDKPPPIPIIPRPVCIPTSISVPIHFTVFTTNFTSAYANALPSSLEQQVKSTNKAFKPLGISFFVATVNYHVGAEFRRFTQHLHKNPDKNWTKYAEKIKMKNRYGENDEVNVWIVESIDDTPECASNRTQGYCTFASALTEANHPTDGCVITIDSLLNATWRYNTGTRGDGTTLTHELGHWFNLKHIFPSKKDAGCTGKSDGIPDTFQFPNDGDEIFEPEQRACCSSDKGDYDYCKGKFKLHVANYMSYSSDMGNLISGDQLGTKPWTKGQRTAMFSAFFTIRRPPKDRTQPVDCNNRIVFADDFVNQRNALRERALGVGGIQKALRGDYILHQSEKLMETLERVCSSPPRPDSNNAIDVISGEEIICRGSGDCDAPPGGPYCLDGSPPPCPLIEVCEDGSDLPCNCTGMCEEGTPLCTEPTNCPNGTALQCSPITEPPVVVCADGSYPLCGGEYLCPTEPPPLSENNGTTCPRACDVHSNACDRATAPNCIFPDPRVAHPRAACACRPGYKATNYPDGDTKNQWRLPIEGQQHRVWVAEGVECDKVCSGYGVNSCREVSEIGEDCV